MCESSTSITRMDLHKQKCQLITDGPCSTNFDDGVLHKKKTCQLITDGPCSTNFDDGAINRNININSIKSINDAVLVYAY